MAVSYATLAGVQLLEARPGTGRAIYECAVSYGAATAGDTGSFSGVGAAISAKVRDGKTRTLRAGAGGMFGFDGTNDVRVGECVVSTNDLTHYFVSSTGVTGTAISATTKPAIIIVTVDEA